MPFNRSLGMLRRLLRIVLGRGDDSVLCFLTTVGLIIERVGASCWACYLFG